MVGLMKYALILDRDSAHVESLLLFCNSHGTGVVRASDLLDAKKQIAHHDVVIAFIDLHGGADDPECSGLSLLEDGTLDGIEALYMSEHDNPALTDEAIRKGASYFFCKPFDPKFIGPILNDIAQEIASQPKAESEGSPCAVDQFGFLRGSSKCMRKLYRLLRKVSQSDASLMIVGESGTGKELVALTVHTLSDRSDEPFVAVNCAAVPESLIESELFGHEKGSFSGALSQRKGLFEQAHGGTLFLDEITEMDISLQTKLLRVIETKELRRLGSEEAIKVDVRLLSASNLAPDQAIRQGKLREDLYYRIAQIPVLVPPLRARGSDICGLAQYFLNALNEKHETNISFTSDALSEIGSRQWPGNVRELKNYVERAYIMADVVIDLSELPELEASLSVAPQSLATESIITMPTGIPLADAERTLILASLERNAGDKKSTADELGISLKTLYNRLRDYESQARSHKPETLSDQEKPDSQA